MYRTKKLILTGLISAGLATLLTLNFSQAAAQQTGQKPSQTEPQKGQKKETQTEDDGPVAITQRSVERTGVPETPKLEQGQIGVVGFPSANSKGDVAFWGRFVSPSSPQGVGRAIFLKSAAGLQIVARDGDKAQNLDFPLLDFNNPSINNKGEVVFAATYQAGSQDGAQPSFTSDGRNKSGIFIKDAKGLRLLAEVGGEVPRMPSHFSSLGNPSFNSGGNLAFIGTYQDPDGRGLFYMDATQDPPKLSLIVRSGQPAATERRTVYSEHFYPSTINERGEIAFFVRLGDSGAVFLKNEKGVELIAQQGLDAPIPEAAPKSSGPKPAATPAGENATPAEAPRKSRYIGFGNAAPSINNKGDVAFVAFFDGENAGRGLFIKEAGREGPPRLLLRSGDPITNTGAQFSSFANPAINARGEVAFLGFYGGRTRGVFLKTAKGVEVIARAEDPVPDGQNGEIFNNFNGVAINDLGEVFFYGQIKNTAMIGLFKRDAKGKVTSFVRRGDPIPDLKVAGNQQSENKK